MFRNYLKTAIRQLTRNRLFSALNILGLAAGLCGSIFIFLWVQDELSFDRQDPQAEDIFRVTTMLGSIHAATTPIGMAPFLLRTLPQVKQIVRLYNSDPKLIAYGDKRFVEKKIWYADSNFQQLFNLPLIEGDARHIFQGKDQVLITQHTAKRYFGDKDPLVNEAALRAMHMDPGTAVGNTIRFNNRKYTIIGIVRDFNFKPVQYNVEPLLMPYNFSRGYRYVVVKTAPGATEKVIAALKKQFALVYPQYVFDYGFLDKDLDALYASEVKMGQLFNVFSLLAIFISCLGLFGLSAYTTQRRIKEIGVRKVLGASVQGIVGLLAREFLMPVALATLIAFPLAGWVMNQWLHAFAYRIGLEWWYFVAAGLLALVVALCTVSFQSFQAATANPVKSLRSE